MNKLIVSFYFLAIFFISCKNNDTITSTQAEVDTVATIQTEVDNIDTTQNQIEPSDDIMYSSQTISEETAQKARIFLQSYLKEDLNLIDKKYRKFEFYETDLNGDKKNEVFVLLDTPNFCGTGGCTVLFIDSDNKLITDFSGKRTPKWVENVIKNGWLIILTNQGGNAEGKGIKELV